MAICREERHGIGIRIPCRWGKPHSNLVINFNLSVRSNHFTCISSRGLNSIQLHELGHNLGLGHAGEDGGGYGDSSCYMGRLCKRYLISKIDLI